METELRNVAYYINEITDHKTTQDSTSEIMASGNEALGSDSGVACGLHERQKRKLFEFLSGVSGFYKERYFYESEWFITKVNDNFKKFTVDAAIAMAVEFMPGYFEIRSCLKSNIETVIEIMRPERKELIYLLY